MEIQSFFLSLIFGGRRFNKQCFQNIISSLQLANKINLLPRQPPLCLQCQWPMYAGYQPEIASLKAQPIGYNFQFHYQSNLNLNYDSEFKKFVNYCREKDILRTDTNRFKEM